MRLLQMIKDSSNGPEQAKRRIEELDKMVQGLKKKRRLCGEQMESDKKRLYWLNKEIGDVEKMKNNLLELFGQEPNAGTDDNMAEFS